MNHLELTKTNMWIDVYIPRTLPTAASGQKLTFPIWQREDCWKLAYKVALILSIISGIDLPKIYIGCIANSDKEYIIDGGHRTRAIAGFMDNEFPVKFKDSREDVYYNKLIEQDSRNTRNLTMSEKKKFDRYDLDIVIYNGISETDCRDIFNKLQNSQPMSVEDVINSWQSDLVDYLRDLLSFTINEKTIEQHFEEIKMMSESVSRTTIMAQLLSWYTMKFPNMAMAIGEDEEEIVSLKYLHKGNTNASALLEYVRAYTDEISHEMKVEFIELVTYIIDYYRSTCKSIHSDVYTRVHSHIHLPTFNPTKYEVLINKIKEWDELTKRGNKLNNNKQYDESKVVFESANELNDKWGTNLEDWVKSRKEGRGASGMKKRMNIVKIYCLN
jgi:hypothetical protein